MGSRENESCFRCFERSFKCLFKSRSAPVGTRCFRRSPQEHQAAGYSTEHRPAQSTTTDYFSNHWASTFFSLFKLYQRAQHQVCIGFLSFFDSEITSIMNDANSTPRVFLDLNEIPIF